MALSPAEKQQAYRDRQAHDAKRDAEAERGARLVVAEQRARKLMPPTDTTPGRWTDSKEEEQRVERAIKYARWYETRLDA